MEWITKTTDFLSDVFKDQRSQLPFIAASGASFAIGIALQSLITKGRPELTTLHAPPRSIAGVASNENGYGHPLPTDVLPGARDVVTPYGTIRVYEWGPEYGPKVAFVHGITTPCIALGGLAHALADRGFRVLLFDLYVIKPCIK